MEVEWGRVKRQRSLTPSSVSSNASNDSRSPSPSLSPAPKYHRKSTSPGPSSRPYICTLPPTCSQPSTSSSYAAEAELLRHQQTFHRWVCRTPMKDRGKKSFNDNALPEALLSRKKGWEWKECGKVFPDERLLNLHQTETHDPLARGRQDRGEKIFQCFVPSPECKKVFLTPAKRRRHLIDKHRYPEEFFFAVTNHGINKIAQEDGLATSLIRPRKNRPPQNQDQSNPPRVTTPRPHAQVPNGQSTNALGQPRTTDTELDELTSSLESSLQFVPRGVRKNEKGQAIHQLS